MIFGQRGALWSGLVLTNSRRVSAARIPPMLYHLGKTFPVFWMVIRTCGHTARSSLSRLPLLRQLPFPPSVSSANQQTVRRLRSMTIFALRFPCMVKTCLLDPLSSGKSLGDVIRQAESGDRTSYTGNTIDSTVQSGMVSERTCCIR